MSIEEKPPEPLCFSIEIQLDARTRLITGDSDLREMIKCQVKALVEVFSTGPKPAVTVNFLNHGPGFK